MGDNIERTILFKLLPNCAIEGKKGKRFILDP